MHGDGHWFAEGGQRSVQIGDGEDLLGRDRQVVGERALDMHADDPEVRAGVPPAVGARVALAAPRHGEQRDPLAEL
jgi:hypothetical protein